MKKCLPKSPGPLCAHMHGSHSSSGACTYAGTRALTLAPWQHMMKGLAIREQGHLIPIRKEVFWNL